MTVKTAYDYRIRRAVEMILDGKVEQASVPHHYWVKSGTDDQTKYLVKVRIDWEEQPGDVLETCCDQYTRKYPDGPFALVGRGPDWYRQLNAMDDAVVYGYSPCNPGISQVNMCPLCKHVLAALLYVGSIQWPNWAEPIKLQPLKFCFARELAKMVARESV